MSAPEAAMTALLEVKCLSKSFGGVHAIKDASLAVEEGEVHALLGLNGSGKSTLIKILAGFHSRDGGEIRLHGRSLDGHDRTADGRPAKIAFVHQELGLLDDLSVSENLFLDVTSRSTALRWFGWRARNDAAAKLLQTYGINLSPAERVGGISSASKALLAIVRAFDRLERLDDTEPGLLVLDEPTVFLTDSERQELFKLIEQLIAKRYGILFVSHDVSDVRAIASRMTVLVGGRSNPAVNVAAVSDDDVVRMLVGGTDPRMAVQTEVTNRTASTTGAKPFHVRRLRGALLAGADFSISPGEIVGLAGVSGSGYEEVGYLLYGAVLGGGQICIGEELVDVGKLRPATARQRGFALVPADRANRAVLPQLSVAENIAMPRLATLTHKRLLRSARVRADADVHAQALQVFPARTEAVLGSLSGGNQQKVVMAKWLATNPHLLLLHEPVQGIDIHAKRQVLQALMGCRQRGMCILWASSDHEELAQVCDRVLIFRDGLVSAELAQPLSHAAITHACFASTVTTGVQS
jgi:ribose transport system ATP-binding protein